jgi:hypothetical protein
MGKARPSLRTAPSKVGIFELSFDFLSGFSHYWFSPSKNGHTLKMIKNFHVLHCQIKFPRIISFKAWIQIYNVYRQI